MLLLPRPLHWYRPLVMCLLFLGIGVLVANVIAAEPPRPPLNKEQQQKLKELNRAAAERQKLSREGKLEEAVAATEKELALFRELFGNEHKSVVFLLQSLAQLQEQREDWAAARRARQEVLAVQQHLYGKEDWRVTDARLALADVEQRSRLTAEQRGQLRQAAELRQQINHLLRSYKHREALPLAQRELLLFKQVLNDRARIGIRRVILLRDIRFQPRADCVGTGSSVLRSSKSLCPYRCGCV